MSGKTVPLGRDTEYPATVDPVVLFPVARARARDPLGLDAAALPFTGVDTWNAWEFSWLDVRGLPRVAVLRFTVPCSSPNIVESKSLKLYLGGYAMTPFTGPEAVRASVERDVSACAGAKVAATLVDANDVERAGIGALAGESLDDQRIEADGYGPPRPELLVASGAIIDETLCTRLFRSLCPVTGQPDWASVVLRYRGPAIEHVGMLRYLVSYRQHPDFHEACVERIFSDVLARCAPEGLSVYARFLRRGGIDINPWRATPRFAEAPGNPREVRQ
ncbi:MAG: NADPH-dependent 7-cyano-7-deazaguanine reductase QueF [Xanthomonadaceae bacterium]|nr:NADPH-dependent 7-cyano-7-deazaguanine reductase QueF [Xanthomonadaceae bacterium]MDE2225721.1 NADPH-dependent 7-cyano-7-deazaguanine reductase QueF [Xanthomonadaceae bacterium]